LLQREDESAVFKVEIPLPYLNKILQAGFRFVRGTFVSIIKREEHQDSCHGVTFYVLTEQKQGKR